MSKKNVFGEVPQYEHDCDNCTFLFIETDDFRQEVYDLYVCVKTDQNGGIDLNVVKRYSSEPSDYTSWTEFDVSSVQALW